MTAREALLSVATELHQLRDADRYDFRQRVALADAEALVRRMASAAETAKGAGPGLVFLAWTEQMPVQDQRSMLAAIGATLSSLRDPAEAIAEIDSVLQDYKPAAEDGGQ